MKQRKKKRNGVQNKLIGVYILLGIIIGALFVTIIVFPEKKAVKKSTAAVVKKEKSHPVSGKKILPEKESTESKSGKQERKQLYIVIDDVGNNIFQLKPFLRLPFKITFAILPRLPYTKEAAEMIHAAGKEYILHQPMDAVGGEKTGPGAIHIGMKEDTVAEIVKGNLKDLPYAAGMNNHMGSAGTADEKLMMYLFHFLKRQHMFFLDSRTTAQSVGRKIAEETGLPFAERSVFLDNKQEKNSIKESIESGMEISEKKGHAIMIGHVWSSELAQILLDLYPTLLEDNYTLNNLTDLFMGYKNDEDPWY